MQGKHTFFTGISHNLDHHVKEFVWFGNQTDPTQDNID